MKNLMQVLQLVIGLERNYYCKQMAFVYEFQY